MELPLADPGGVKKDHKGSKPRWARGNARMKSVFHHDFRDCNYSKCSTLRTRSRFGGRTSVPLTEVGPEIVGRLGMIDDQGCLEPDG